MASPIATLAVRLSAQIAEFQQSFTEASKSVDSFKSSFEKAAAGIQGTLDGISKTFSQFGSVVGTIGVAVAGVTIAAAGVAVAFKAVESAVSTAFGAISEAVSHTAELGDSLFALSQKTGLSVESLSGFKFVAQQTNTSLESITGAVFKLEANLGAGAKKTTEALQGLGLSLKTLRGEDPSEAFTQILAKLGELPNASARAAAGVALFGKSFKDIAQLSQEDLPALIAQAKELGVVMSQETAVASDRLKDGLGAISAATNGLSQQLGAKLIPAAVAFVEVFGGIFIDAIKQVTKSTGNMGEGFDAFAIQLGEVAARVIEVLARIVEATAQWASESIKSANFVIQADLKIIDSMITAGKAIDLAIGGGTHQKGFDDLRANIESLKKPLDAVASGSITAGKTIRELAAGIAEAAKGAGATFGFTFSGIQAQIAESADKMRKSLKAVGDGGIGGEGGDAFKSFEKGLADLTAQIDRAVGTGTPLAEMVRLFGDEASKATAKGAAFGITVSASVQEIGKAFDTLKQNKVIDEMAADWIKLQADFAKGADKVFDHWMQAEQKAAAASAASLIKLVGEQQKYQERVDTLGMSGLKLTLHNIDATEAAERKGWGDRTTQNASAYDKLSGLSEAYYAHERKLALGTADTIEERMKRQGVLTKTELQQLADDAKRDYDQMLASGLFTYDELQKAAERAGVLQAAATGKVASAWQKAFQKISDDLPGIILGALQGGGNVLAAAAQGLGTIVGDSFKNAFAKALQEAGGDIDKLGFKAKALGIAATGIQAFTSGLAIGGAAGSKGKGALAGAAGGAVAGLPLAAATGGLSVAVGAGIGAIGGFFGGRAAEKEARKALEESKIALAAQFGGLEKLRATAQKLGVDIQKAFDTKSPKEFQKSVDSLNAAIEAQNKRIDGLNRAMTAVNSRGESFVKQFGGLKDINQQLGELNNLSNAIRFGAPGGGAGLFGNTDLLSKADQARLNDLDAQWDHLKAKQRDVMASAQTQFDRFGLSVRDTFAGLIKENGDAFAAIESLGPAFAALKTGVDEFGLAASPVIQGLLDDFNLVNDEITGPFLKNVQESGQILKGLFDAKALSPEGFQALAADIGQSLQEVINRGGDIAKALALSQPVLQSLWEAQKTFGGVTDQTTQSILDQAEAQGLVGEQFKSTQQKVLDVLVAIAHVFHADIPEGIEATAAAATTAATTVGTAFDGAATAAGEAVRVKIGGSFKDIIIPAGEAGDKMRQELETQAAEAAKGIKASLGGAAEDSAHNIEFKVGRSLDGLAGKATHAADGIDRALSGIDIPPIPITLDLDASALDRIPDDIRIRTSIEVPAFATGAIVHKRTLAIIGEAGPEAVVPLNRAGEFRAPAPTGTVAPAAVTFEAGSVVINGDVDSNARAERVVRDFARVVRRGGDSRTVALRSLGLEKV